MLKSCVPILIVALFVSAAQGQTVITLEDYLKSSVAHLRKGEIDAALSDVNKALQLNPANAEAYLIRAVIRDKKGDADGVLADYDKFIELAPNAPAVEAIYNNRGMARQLRGDVEGALDDLNKAISHSPRVAEFSTDAPSPDYRRETRTAHWQTMRKPSS